MKNDLNMNGTEINEELDEVVSSVLSTSSGNDDIKYLAECHMTYKIGKLLLPPVNIVAGR